MSAVCRERVGADDRKAGFVVEQCAEYIVKVGVRPVGPQPLTDP